MKGWDCVKCGASLGTIEDGVLVVDDGCKVSVDVNKIIVQCAECGATKVWYVRDRLTNLAREIMAEFRAAASKDMISKRG